MKTNKTKGESIMDTIVEQQLRRELAMKNIVIGNKIQFYNNYFADYY